MPYTGYVGALPYSAYGSLEKPLDLPTLALMPPPSTVYSSGIFPGSYAGVYPGYVLPEGTTFPSSLAAPDVILPSSLAAPDAPVSATPTAIEQPTTETVQVPPVEGAAPEAPVEAPEQYAADTAEPPPVVEAQKSPWAPDRGEEEFDLDYSRQIAARPVVGEEGE